MLAAAAAASAQVSVQAHTVGTTPRDIVINPDAIKPFVDAAKTRRVDIIGIGDSNQIGGPGNDYGWDHGYAKAWTEHYGTYATEVLNTTGEGGWGGAGYLASGGAPYGASATGAPAELDKYRMFYDSQGDAINDFPPTYAYMGSSYVEPTDHWSPTARVLPSNPLWGQNLTWNFTYGTFANGTGGFMPNASSSFVTVADGPRISTSTGVVGLHDGSLSLPASAYQQLTQPLDFSFSPYATSTIQGPFFAQYQRVTGDRASGVSYSTILAQGGRALVHAATALQTQSDDALKEYIRNVVRYQDGAPMLLVDVTHGGNDGGWHIPSVGPAHVADSSTPAGFADDITAVAERLRGVWTAMGYDPKNLMFQYGPYHPTDGDAGGGQTKIQRLAAWEDAVIQLSQQHPEYNLSIVRGTRVTTPLTMATSNWYDPGGDAHLTPAGYEGVAKLAVDQIVAYTDPNAVPNQSNVTSLSFTFNTDVSANLTPDDLLLHHLDDDTFVPSSALAVNWDAATLTATWYFQDLPLGELQAGQWDGTLKTSTLGGALAGGGPAGSDYTFSFTASPIPEPAAAAVLLVAAGAALARRRSRRS